MKRTLWKVAAFLGITAVGASVTADACSDLIVGPKASADGSIYISYAADSHTLYGALYHWPAATWTAGSMLDVTEWDSGMYTGKIAQVERTYNVVGNMNEKQVAITESTWGGCDVCQKTEGLMDYGSLIYIALQRSASAREAIKVMTSLVDTYGYKSSGESFTIADKNEVWVMEMIGKGAGEKGAVWVAIRIPDNAISAHANQARIQQIPFKDKANCMYSPDVVDFARKKGLYKGTDADFSFQKAYNPYDFGGLRGCEARVWSFFNRFADGMDKYLPLVMGNEPDAEPMPLYVVPNRKLSLADVQNMMRDHYEGTPMDMTKDPGTGPYKVPYRWRPMNFEVNGQTYVNERAIATQQTGFVLVAQLRKDLPDYVGGILWFGVDDADMTLFKPMYTSMTRIPWSFSEENGSMTKFSWTSAFWMHNWVANMAYGKYSYMIEDIRKEQQRIEGQWQAMQPIVEKQAMAIAKDQGEAAAVEFLTNYSCNIADQSTSDWKKLGEYLMVKYIDGNVKIEKDGKFAEEHGIVVFPKQPGYSQEYYDQVAAGENVEHLKVPGKK
ncbi:dipeptidase [Porphyromonas levii]|uniref:dipeptidase n=1 Tax=Porphyromonas levii TaxID=28114 RepID=UPI00036F55AD|nr:C69 family dipeptidase [Porphyromonas levii]